MEKKNKKCDLFFFYQYYGCNVIYAGLQVPCSTGQSNNSVIAIEYSNLSPIFIARYKYSS